MTRLLTLIGYGVLAGGAVGLELAARRSRRLATFGDVLDVVLRRWPVRAALLAGWLWLGWHLFVRADWR
jgi:hypothetical protein